MSKLGKILAGGLIIGSLAGCNSLGTSNKEYSEILHEDATVVAVIETPRVWGTGGENVDSVKVTRDYGVLFNLHNGNGSILYTGRTQNHKDLAARFRGKEGTVVDVVYQEIYWRTKTDTDGDGKVDTALVTHEDNYFIGAYTKLENDR